MTYMRYDDRKAMLRRFRELFPEMPEAQADEYAAAVERLPRLDVAQYDLDGVEWADAPLPRRFHRCWPQTYAVDAGTRVERCACGAIRNSRFRFWLEKNSRRKGDA